MISSSLIKELKERGLISKITNEKALTEKMERGPISLFCGFDPTADSLHLGHLVPLLCLRRFQDAGNNPIALIGGATGMIGDPSFRLTERQTNTTSNISEWIDKIHYQISSVLNFNCTNNKAKIINNYSWFSSINLLTFLRDIGKYFSVNQMINREAIKQRINREDQGISFSEFSYNLLQSYDFAYLNKHYNVILQIGGSDQWGNITSGINLTRRLYKSQVIGLTLPLITKSDGTKFGKTESETIWLDAKKTSPYKFYQFWINTSDADVYRFLKFFTFMKVEEINDIERRDKKRSNKVPPLAQYILAEQITYLVHGKSGLEAAKRITHSLFSGHLRNLTESDFEQLTQDGMPVITLETGFNLQQALIASDLVTSYRQARSMIESNAVAINGKKQSDLKYCFNENDKLFGRFTLLKRGKKHHCLICWKQ